MSATTTRDAYRDAALLLLAPYAADPCVAAHLAGDPAADGYIDWPNILQYHWHPSARAVLEVAASLDNGAHRVDVGWLVANITPADMALVLEAVNELRRRLDLAQAELAAQAEVQPVGELPGPRDFSVPELPADDWAWPAPWATTPVDADEGSEGDG